MGLFGRYLEKKKEKRLEREIENKKRTLVVQQEKTKKIEEEIDKMVKLELKDGKLQKVVERKDDVPDTLPPLNIPQRQITPAEEQAEEMIRQQTEAMMMQMERDRQQQIYNQQAALAQQQQMAAYAQQQQMAAMTQQQQMPQQPMSRPVVTFHILMTEGREAKEEIYEDVVDKLTTDIDEAIASCTTIPFGQRVLNGRYILEYMYY